MPELVALSLLKSEILFHPDDRNTAESDEVIALLETIDDDLDEHGIVFVKISDDLCEKEWGIDETPAVVYFENGIPYLYDGK